MGILCLWTGCARDILWQRIRCLSRVGGSDANCDLVPDKTTVRGIRLQRVLLRNQHHDLLIDCASPPEIDKPDLKSRGNFLSFGYYQYPKLVPYLLI